MAHVLPSWRAGPARDAILAFLDAAQDLPVRQRVAVLDQDGTLCTEYPVSVQFAYFMYELRNAVAADPSLGERPDYRILLEGDPAALRRFGLRRIVMTLADLATEVTPEEFTSRVRTFMATCRHPKRGVPYGQLVYQPMRELIDELRARQFGVFVTTFGGIEFLRAVGEDLYGVPPEAMVGTPVAYRYEERDDGPVLLRTGHVIAEINEGPSQVVNIQTLLGRRPILTAGNSVADRAMIEYTLAGGWPTLALLINHDDPVREYAYRSRALTITEAEPILDVGARLGWTTVSMRDDWSTIFAENGGKG